MHRLSGVFCAFWTPTGPAGDILWENIDRHLNFLSGAGVHGLMALGSTAEFPHLSLPQRKEILERLVKTKLHVIANVSDVSHRNAIELSRHAYQQGALAAAVLPPWFFAMQQRDIAEFFISVGKESEMPLVLYNYPEMTGKKIELETIRQVAEAVPVLGVKQSGGEYGYHRDLLKLGKKIGFAVLSGADTRFEEILNLGCAGTVSGLANAVPDVLRKTYDNFQSGKKSPRETKILAGLGQLVGSLEFPLNVKAAIAARGIETGKLKNPVSDETERAYQSLLGKLKKYYVKSGLKKPKA